MDKPPLNPGFDTATEAEGAFYQAFRDLSFVAMDRVWAPDGVACLHPGGQLLTGRKAVMDSWARILSAHEAPELRYEKDAEQSGGELVLHMVREVIAPGTGQPPVTVQAVNAYRRYALGWLMVLHHATLPLVSPEPRESSISTPRPLQ